MHIAAHFSFIAVLGVLLTACASIVTPPPPTQIPKLGTALGPSWTPVPLPDSRLTPGAIVSVVPVSAKVVDLRWLGSLQGSCGVPAAALGLTPGNVPEGLRAGSTVEVGADVGATI